MCQALADIYRASNNASDPWDNEKGWELTSTAPCSKLVARGSPRQAVYCSWFGITCCTPTGVAGGECSVVNGVTALELPINNLNVSLGNPLLLPSLHKLHDCGMRVLNLEANNIIGPFTDAWGELHRLTVFNFGELVVSSCADLKHHATARERRGGSSSSAGVGANATHPRRSRGSRKLTCEHPAGLPSPRRTNKQATAGFRAEFPQVCRG
jgi:hypothetical protein